MYASFEKPIMFDTKLCVLLLQCIWLCCLFPTIFLMNSVAPEQNLFNISNELKTFCHENVDPICIRVLRY